MKKNLLLCFVVLYTLSLNAQKTVQNLTPTRVSIFKNGTYFVKKSGSINVIDKTFSIESPTNALMGSFWVSAGKTATIKSILIKRDTIKVESTCKSFADYFMSHINSDIIIYRGYNDKENITGKLLDYSETSGFAKLKTPDNKILVTKVSDYDKVSFIETKNSVCTSDKIKPVATIHLNENINTTQASTLCLQNGMQWVPSYLFTVLNDKEATITMKATIVNKQESLLNADVDIIIGNPEMFYGKTLDPISFGYLNNEVFSGSYANTTNYNFSLANSLSQSVSNRASDDDEGYDEDTPIPEYNEKTGDKLEDLYIYKLGKVDLEKDATVLVPVLTTKVSYEDVYTIDLAYNSAANSNKTPLEVFHQYRILNNTTAPLTTGSILVMNADEMPIAQSQLNYTPVNGKQEINLSKAIDVQVKNEELEVKREKDARKINKESMADKVLYNGTVKLNNFQSKKIKITIKKSIVGTVNEVSEKGTIKKAKETNNNINSFSTIAWEIELNPGEKKELTYSYSIFEKQKYKVNTVSRVCLQVKFYEKNIFEECIQRFLDYNILLCTFFVATMIFAFRKVAPFKTTSVIAVLLRSYDFLVFHLSRYQ